MKNILFVGGTWNDNGGKPSSIMNSVSEFFPDADFYNGGCFSDLEQLSIEKYKKIVWFADVPNDKVKMVSTIKKRNPTCLLVTSKRNVDGKYSIHALIAHALKNKSNLFLEFSKEGNQYIGRLFDPLGNVWVDSNDFVYIGSCLRKRMNEISNFVRIQSTREGNAIEVPEQPEFFSLIKNLAEVFHSLIHGIQTDRFLGNASFRCERGFPSFKYNDLIFVSKRNIDKRHIERDGFVAVVPNLDLGVRYYGEFKPSVDTPIQIKLYDFYKNVKFALHSHVYIKDAVKTERVLPCGVLEEFDEVIKLFPDEKISNFAINLKGHGSLVLSDSVEFIKEQKFISRPIPESQNLGE